MQSKIFFCSNGVFNPVQAFALVSDEVASKSSLDVPSCFSVDPLSSLVEGIGNDFLGKHITHQILGQSPNLSTTVYRPDYNPLRFYCPLHVVSKDVFLKGILDAEGCSLFEGF